MKNKERNFTKGQRFLHRIFLQTQEDQAWVAIFSRLGMGKYSRSSWEDNSYQHPLVRALEPDPRIPSLSGVLTDKKPPSAEPTLRRYVRVGGFARDWWQNHRPTRLSTVAAHKTSLLKQHTQMMARVTMRMLLDLFSPAKQMLNIFL